MNLLRNVAEHDGLDENALGEHARYEVLEVVDGEVVDGVEKLLLAPRLLADQHGRVVDRVLERLLGLVVD